MKKGIKNLNTSHVNVKLVAVSDIVSDIPSFKYISC